MYRHRISIEEPSSSKDSEGNDIITWSPIALSSSTDAASLPARVRPLSSRELLGLDVKRAETRVAFEIRWVPGVTSSCRIVWQGRAYEIDDPIADYTAKRHLTIIGTAISG